MIDDIFHPRPSFVRFAFCMFVIQMGTDWFVLFLCDAALCSHQFLILSRSLSIFRITFSARQYIINTITTIYCGCHWSQKCCFSASSTETTSPSSGSKCVFLAARFLLCSQSQMKTQQVCSHHIQRAANIQLDIT